MSWTQFHKKLTSNYVEQKLQLERKLLIFFSTIPIQLPLLYLTIAMKIYPEFYFFFFIGNIIKKEIGERIQGAHNNEQRATQKNKETKESRSYAKRQ